MKTTKFWFCFALALGAIGLAGCSTPSSRIEANRAAFDRLTPQQQALVKAGQIAIGFDMDTVKLALGDPNRITVRTTAGGQNQVWHYVTYESDNGIILYSGYYHGFYRHPGWGWGGGWWGWGPGYPYYLDYPNRVVHDRFIVEFNSQGRVMAITQDMP